MGRRTLIKSQPTKKVRSFASMAGEPHFHFCKVRDCRLIFEDSCASPEINGRCHVCRGARRPLWIAARDPSECCLGNCVQVTDKAILRSYSLAGPGPWFQCKTCARCHGWPCTL